MVRSWWSMAPAGRRTWRHGCCRWARMRCSARPWMSLAGPLGFVSRAGYWPGPQGDGGSAPQLRAARSAAGLDGDAVDERGDELGQGARVGVRWQVAVGLGAAVGGAQGVWGVWTGGLGVVAGRCGL